MKDRKKKSDKKKKPPKFQRGLIAMCILAAFGAGVLLDQFIAPDGGATLKSLDAELPILLQGAVVVAAFFRDFWMHAGIATVAVAGLAWLGALDKLLKPALAFALAAVLVVGGSAALAWDSNNKAAENVGAQPR